MEVKKAKERSESLVARLNDELKSYEYMARLWNEFEPGLITITDVKLKTVKIAGVPTPALEEVLYEVKDINLFTKPIWFADGVSVNDSPGVTVLTCFPLSGRAFTSGSL